MGKDTLELFVRCAAGFEDVLADELRTLRLGRVRPQVGGVSATGRLVDAYRASIRVSMPWLGKTRSGKAPR